MNKAFLYQLKTNLLTKVNMIGRQARFIYSKIKKINTYTPLYRG